MIKSREISSRELTELLLTRIGERNPALNAIIELRSAGVLDDASGADDAMRRRAPLPRDVHHGVSARPQAVEQRVIQTPVGDRAYSDLSFWTSHASLPGLPAVSAPVALCPAGLPVAVQIIGPRDHDDTPITFAELLTELTGTYEPPGMIRD